MTEGDAHQPEALTRPSKLVCETCGLPLPDPHSPCPKCSETKGLFLRSIGLMRPYFGYVLVLLGLSAIAVGLEQLPPQITRVLFDRVLVPRSNQELLLWILTALVVTHLIQQVLAVFNGRMSAWIGTRVTYEIREMLQRRLLEVSVDYHDRHSAGSLMSRVLYDTEYFQSFVQQVSQGLLVSLFRVLAIGAILFTMNWQLALFVLIPIPVSAVCTYVFWRYLYPMHYQFRDSRSKISQLLSGLYSGVRLVKAFAQEDREMERFDESSKYTQEAYRALLMSQAIFNPVIVFLFALGGVAVWYVGGQKVLAGELTMGTLVAFISYVGMFYTPVRALSAFSNWMSGFLTAGQRVFEVLDAASAVPVKKETEPLDDVKGGIELQDVTFGYDPFSPVLKDVSLSIEPGEFIGIVGKSGSGKTTMINMVCRFYDPQEGKVLIDGMDVRDVRPSDLHRHIGLVLQEPFLFRASVAENIAYGRPDATPLEIQNAARAANAHEFISRMPDGYDTRLGERGAGLSGGERQRVSIARALLCDPRILILDEATSSVDTESEQEIQRALAELCKGRTTIAIAHRLATLKNSDRIFVIDEGRVAEVGSHEELMAREGIYYRLVKIQTELTRLEVD